jgi:arylsulfatase A-like enzyme
MLDRVRGSKPPLDLKTINHTAVLAKVYPPNAQLLDDIRDVYDASVMEIDAALRGYFAALEARGMLDHAVVIVTADHGDEFMEHGAFSHGDTLYDEALRVPLIVRTPGQADGHVVDRLVSLVDVAPTVLELAGVPRPARFAGTSFALDLKPDGIRATLRRAVERLMDERPEPAAFSERRMDAEKEPPTAHVRSVVAGSAKLIESADGSRVFYDLATDPREQRPNELGDAGRSMLATRLGAIQSRIRAASANAEERELDEQSREALRALGYAQ